MSLEKDDTYLEKAKARLSGGFQGEEDLEDVSTAQKDLVAACVIAAFAVFAMVLAWQMPDPGRTVYTHPGLLPMVTGVSLLAMAIGLAIRAVREGGARNLLSMLPRSTDAAEERDQNRRAWLLIALVVAFVVALDVVTFRLRFPVGGIELKLSSFEFVAIPMTAAILKIFWKASLLRCIVTAVIAVLLLTAAFRYGFKIPMPGVD